MGKTWRVKFAYSGSGKREFFEKDFELKVGQNIEIIINHFVTNQNSGEAKSDRIRVWSKKQLQGKVEYFFNGVWNKSMLGSEGEINKWIEEGEKTRIV